MNTWSGVGKASCATQTTCGIGEKISADTDTAARTCSVCDADTYQDGMDHRDTSCIPQPICHQGEGISTDNKKAARTCSLCVAGQFQGVAGHRNTQCTGAQSSCCVLQLSQ